MRIVITGSHGTGKTTIAKQIYSYIKNEEIKAEINTNNLQKNKIFSGRQTYCFLPEAALQAYEIGLPINENTSVETEVWIFAKQLEMEMKIKNNWVADKCFIDLLAYGKFLFPHNYELINILTQVALPRMHKYDLVIFTPCGEFPIEDDGIRSLDPRFQSEIDKIIIKIMKEHNIQYHKITGGKEERYKQALKLLN